MVNNWIPRWALLIHYCNIPLEMLHIWFALIYAKAATGTLYTVLESHVPSFEVLLAS